jgi:molybdopterin biosynthesis enzyme
MPVDPGNLLLIGTAKGHPVIAAPGCARSPKENGLNTHTEALEPMDSIATVFRE